MSQDILAMIDGAVEAWETSPDAMRWSPDPVIPTMADEWVALYARVAELFEVPLADMGMQRHFRESQARREAQDRLRTEMHMFTRAYIGYWTPHADILARHDPT